MSKEEATNKSETYEMYLAEEAKKLVEIKQSYSSQIDDLQEQLEIARRQFIG
jgi:hypothetical protein